MSYKTRLHCTGIGWRNSQTPCVVVSERMEFVYANAPARALVPRLDFEARLVRDAEAIRDRIVAKGA
jgi:hypothetical protein